jgi:hypothetical protein
MEMGLLMAGRDACDARRIQHCTLDIVSANQTQHTAWSCERRLVHRRLERPWVDTLTQASLGNCRIRTRTCAKLKHKSESWISMLHFKFTEPHATVFSNGKSTWKSPNNGWWTSCWFGGELLLLASVSILYNHLESVYYRMSGIYQVYLWHIPNSYICQVYTWNIPPCQKLGFHWFQCMYPFHRSCALVYWGLKRRKIISSAVTVLKSL